MANDEISKPEPIEQLEKQLKALTQKVQNIEVELYFPIAKATLKDGSEKTRITIKGVVDTICRKLFGKIEVVNGPINGKQ